MKLNDLKLDKLKRFNIITGPGGIDNHHVYYDIELPLIETGDTNIVKIDAIDVLCKNPIIYKSPSLMRKVRSKGLLILKDALDIPTPEMKLENQESFFDDLFERIRALDAKVIITTENTDVIKNFCVSSVKTDHDDCAYFKLYLENPDSCTWLVEETPPQNILNLMAIGEEVRFLGKRLGGILMSKFGKSRYGLSKEMQISLRLENTLEEIMWSIGNVMEFFHSQFEVREGKCPEREKQDKLMWSASDSIYDCIEEERNIVNKKVSSL